MTNDVLVAKPSTHAQDFCAKRFINNFRARPALSPACRLTFFKSFSKFADLSWKRKQCRRHSSGVLFLLKIENKKDKKKDRQTNRKKERERENWRDRENWRTWRYSRWRG